MLGPARVPIGKSRKRLGHWKFSAKRATRLTTVIVDVTSSTTYKDHKVTSASFAKVTTGEMVSVEGTTTSGVVTATNVTIGFGGGMWGHGQH